MTIQLGPDSGILQKADKISASLRPRWLGSPLCFDRLSWITQCVKAMKEQEG